MVDEIISITAMLSIGAALFFEPKERKVEAENTKKGFFRPGGKHMYKAVI